MSTQSSLPSQNLTWDLTHLYADINDPAIERDTDRAREKVAEFVGKYKGVFGENTKSLKVLPQAIRDYEVMDEIFGKIGTYAYLQYSTNQNTAEIVQFFQSISETLTQISTDLIFFSLDLNLVPQEIFDQEIKSNPDLARYESWIKRLRLWKNHQLSAELEKLMSEKSLTGRSAWVRLYDETLTRVRFTFEGEEHTVSTLVEFLSDVDPSVREKSARSFSKGLENILPIMTFVTNTLAKDKELDDTWRVHPTSTHARHLSNNVEPEVVEALVTAVQQAYPKLAHRYYPLKKKILGLDKFEYWDRNAPLSQGDDSKIEWSKAQEIVLNAYQAFSPEMAKIGKRFFDEKWIDVLPRAGKTSGAYSHPCVPSVHPYILLNYQGKMRDVMTLAHELGHGVHQVLSSTQGQLLSDTPLTIAETASVFGEMLTFQSLLKEAKSPLERQKLLAGKIDDMINTVVRQIAFYIFEQRVHEKRRIKELSTEDLALIWMETQRDALGPDVNLDPSISNYWSYISHFIHSPFYVYAYAFGDCLVNSLFAIYQREPQGFEAKYLDVLKAGGIKRYDVLLAPFGLDLKHPQFWNEGLSMISGLIDQLEELC